MFQKKQEHFATLYLLGGLGHESYDFSYLGMSSSTDELRGVGIPPTRY